MRGLGYKDDGTDGHGKQREKERERAGFLHEFAALRSKNHLLSLLPLTQYRAEYIKNRFLSLVFVKVSNQA